MTDLGDRLDALATEATRGVTLLPLDLAGHARRRHLRRVRTGIAATACAALAASGAIYWPSGNHHDVRVATASGITAPTLSMPDAVHNQSAARALAESLLGRVALPATSRITRSAASPALATAPQRPMSTNAADATRFATSTLDPASVLAFFRAHPPQGYTTNGSGSGSVTTPGHTTVVYLIDHLQGMPSAVHAATVLLAATPAPHNRGSAIRIDAQVEWFPPPPPSFTVPSTVALATVTLTYTDPAQAAAQHQPAARSTTVTDPTRLHALQAAVDGLQAPLHGNFSCIPDTARYKIEFFSARSGRADLTVQTGPCGTVTATTLDGRSTTLANDQALNAAYRTALDLPTG